MRKIVFLCLFCSLLGVLTVAQSTTDGAIGGTIFDVSGAVVGGAKIVVHNNGTNAEQTVDADASGYYRVGGLQPGTYTVTINGGGLAPYKAEKVIVQVGSLTEVSPHLGVSGTHETVEVTAEAPQINYVSQDFTSTMNQTAIANLPINGGRWSNFALLTPSVVSDSNNFGLLSFRGISTLLNNNTVDGADNNQAFFSEERGRTRAGYSTPKEAVQEFQVNTSDYSAEYGRSAGGVVNTVTKSGTNQIHGTGYFFDRDNTWGAFNEFTTINVQTAPGVFTPQPFKPTDWRKMAGFGVGGPMIKDKVFFYLAYDWYHHNFPGVAAPQNPGPFLGPPSATDTKIFAQRLNGLSSTTNPSPAQLSAATALYNTDLAALATTLGQVPREGDQNIIFPKVDWTIDSKNHASFSFNRMRWNSPAGVQTAAVVNNGIADFGNDFVKDTWGVAKLDSVITNNFANELRFQYGRDFEFEFAQKPTPYELANLVNTPTFTNPSGLPPGVNLNGLNGSSFFVGVSNFLNRVAFPDEVRQQYADTVTLSHAKHTIKFGFDYSNVDDNAINLFNGFGTYNYFGNAESGLVDYFLDLNKQNSCPGNLPCYSSFSQGLGLPGLDFTTNDYAGFIQDDWKVRPRLSLSFGMRYEYEKFPHPLPSLINPNVPQTANKPSDKEDFGPRAGFAWDIFGSGKTVLRGGYGIYYGRAINSTIFNALTVTGVQASQVSITLTPGQTGAPVFPAVTSLANVGNLKIVKNVDFFDHAFRLPQIQQMDLTLEHDMGWGTVLSVSYLGSLGRHLPDFIDTNICTSASQVRSDGSQCPAPGTVSYQVNGGGPLGSGPYTTRLFTSRINPAFGSFLDIVSGINSDYHALVMQLNHRISHNVQFGASYTWSHAYDFGQNQTTFTPNSGFSTLFPDTIRPERGNSIYDVPNRFVMDAVMQSPWRGSGWHAWLVNGWELSPIIQVQNGLPYNLTVGGGAPGGIPGTTSINGSGGTNRIDVLGANHFRMPYLLEADGRLAKSFSLQEKYRLELSADFFNTLNRQNVTQVVTRGYTISTSGACSKTAPCLNFSPAFGTRSNTNNSNFLYTPRQIQLGARVSF